MAAKEGEDQKGDENRRKEYASGRREPEATRQGRRKDQKEPEIKERPEAKRKTGQNGDWRA